MVVSLRFGCLTRWCPTSLRWFMPIGAQKNSRALHCSILFPIFVYGGPRIFLESFGFTPSGSLSAAHFGIDLNSISAVERLTPFCLPLPDSDTSDTRLGYRNIGAASTQIHTSAAPLHEREVRRSRESRVADRERRTRKVGALAPSPSLSRSWSRISSSVSRTRIPSQRDVKIFLVFSPLSWVADHTHTLNQLIGWCSLGFWVVFFLTRERISLDVLSFLKIFGLQGRHFGKLDVGTLRFGLWRNLYVM